jgi:hypothetical protein
MDSPKQGLARTSCSCHTCPPARHVHLYPKSHHRTVPPALAACNIMQQSQRSRAPAAVRRPVSQHSMSPKLKNTSCEGMNVRIVLWMGCDLQHATTRGQNTCATTHKQQRQQRNRRLRNRPSHYNHVRHRQTPIKQLCVGESLPYLQASRPAKQQHQKHSPTVQ